MRRNAETCARPRESVTQVAASSQRVDLTHDEVWYRSTSLGERLDRMDYNPVSIALAGDAVAVTMTKHNMEDKGITART